MLLSPLSTMWTSKFYEPFTICVRIYRFRSCDTNGMRWSGGKLTTGVASLCDPEQMKHYTVHLSLSGPHCNQFHERTFNAAAKHTHGRIHLNSCISVLIAPQWSDTIRAN